MTVIDREPRLAGDVDPQTVLNEQFEFSLNGHELIDPDTTRGYVTALNEVKVTEPFYEGVKVYEIKVVDPFVDADPEGYKLVNRHVSKMEQLMAADGYDPLMERTKVSSRSRDSCNKYTEAWLAQEELKSLKIWHSHVPHATALSFLTSPIVGAEIEGRKRMKGTTDVITAETAAFIRFVDDAVAIRDRGTAMEYLAARHIQRAQEHGGEVKWLSLASGTAEPSIQAAKTASVEGGVDVDITVVDYDATALKEVERNKQAIGFAGSVNTVEADILFPDNLRAEIARKTGYDGKYDVVENMGFEEYLPQAGDSVGAKDGEGLPQASEFTKGTWDNVGEKGVLISGNMILDRSQLGFVFGIVKWPIINARTEEEILNVYKQAGIIDDPGAIVSMFRVINEQTGTHLYNIIEVEKAA